MCVFGCMFLCVFVLDVWVCLNLFIMSMGVILFCDVFLCDLFPRVDHSLSENMRLYLQGPNVKEFPDNAIGVS